MRGNARRTTNQMMDLKPEGKGKGNGQFSLDLDLPFFLCRGGSIFDICKL